MIAHAALRPVVNALATILVTAMLASPSAVSMAGAADATPAVRAQMLVDTAWLASHLDDPGLVVLHAGKARDAYDRAHVPGARFVALADVAATRRGVPNELPSVDDLTALVRRLGITGEPEERIVIYGDDGLFAARVFVALDFLGLAERVSLLDGQWAAWQAEGRPTTAKVRPAVASEVVLRLSPDRVADRAAVAKLSREVTSLARPHAALVDARPRAQFDGSEAGEGIGRPGHIPGAVSAFWKEDLQDGGTPRLRPPDELRSRYATLGVDPDAATVVYCRTGVQASHTYFVLSYLGYDVRLYDGSFAEWSAAPDAPVARP